MLACRHDRLSDRQATLAEKWFPDALLLNDLSWNAGSTTVLDVESGRGRVIIKAGRPDNHHLAREITAYQGFTSCLGRTGHAPALVHHDRAANILAISHLDGSLVMASDAEFATATYEQAGTLVRTFHRQAARLDPDWDRATVAKSIGWLDKPHRIEADTAAVLRDILARHTPGPVTVVPTHGDWQPRNWLIDDGTITVIDFGRFAWRPAATDFCRLAAQQWRVNSQLEDAFFAGYGSDPRTPDSWRVIALYEAIATAVWAHQVDDDEFEQQGHRMIADALEMFGR